MLRDRERMGHACECKERDGEKEESEYVFSLFFVSANLSMSLLSPKVLESG